MFILSLILLIAIGALITFTYKLMQLIKQNDFTSVLTFFRKYLTVVFIGIFLIYFVMIITSIITLDMGEFIFVLLIKLFIHLVFFVSIFQSARHIIKNLQSNIIFDQSNATLIHSIGATFLYMSIVEIIAGFVVGVIYFLSGFPNQDFMIQTNTTLVLFILFGLILLLVSFILKKAIEIDEENKLTI